MKYFKSKGGRLFLNDNIFFDTDYLEINKSGGNPDMDFYIECTKGEFLLAYEKMKKRLDKLAGI